MTEMSTVIGVDPGLDGGIARLRLDDKGAIVVAKTYPMPKKAGAKKGRDVDAGELRRLILKWRDIQPTIVLAVVEAVHSMPAQGVASSFKFGVNFGRLLGVLEALDVPVSMVTPQRWKKSVLDGLGREKSDAIRWVQSRFPQLSLLATERSKNPHDGMAEAVCIAEFARRLWLKGGDD